MTRVPLALVLDAPSEALPAALARAAALGFTHVELPGLADRPTAHRDALADSGLVVAGVELLPPADCSTLDQRRTALADLFGQIADAALLGAAAVLLDPTPFAALPATQRQELWQRLAEAAASRMMPLYLGAPGQTCPPLVHPNINLWLHLSETDTNSIPSLRPRLGAVRLHLHGPSAASQLRAARRALSQAGYQYPLAIRLTAGAVLERLGIELDP